MTNQIMLAFVTRAFLAGRSVWLATAKEALDTAVLTGTLLMGL